MEQIDFARYIVAFIFVVALILGLGVLLRRVSPNMPKDSASARLKVVEVRPIDVKRKLVLVRHDDVEHLLLLADGREMVIESGIEVRE